jgi:hypothetical protein
VKTPHLLLAGNCHRVRSNIAHILSAHSVQALDDEIAANARALITLGQQHFTFAGSLSRSQWRQTVSRAYYGAFGVVRGIRLYVDGHYSTENAEHKKIDALPMDFPNRATYSIQLPVLREDRNLCDYDHTATEDDLAISRDDALALVDNLIDDARRYLEARGLTIP